MSMGNDLEFRYSKAYKAAALLYALFLIFIFMEGVPFQERVFILESIEDVAGGAWQRQAFFIFVLFSMLMLSVQANRENVLALVRLPFSLYLLVVCCVVSALLSDAQLISLRRLTLTVIVFYISFLSVLMLKPVNALKIMTRVLIVLLAISVFSGAFIDSARHLPDEADQNLVGAWRGVFYHKNTAGMMSAICAMLCASWMIEKPRVEWILGVVISLVMLAATQSKTSMLLLLVFFVVFIFCFLTRYVPRIKSIIPKVFSGMVALSLVFLYVFSEDFLLILQDPRLFTGRMEIWWMVVNVIKDNPWFGVGLGVLYKAGESTVILNYAGDGWLSRIDHGHQGYLDVIASLGFIGFSVFLYSVVIRPFKNILKVGFNKNKSVFSILCSLMLFVLIHNLLETSFLSGARPLWAVTCVIISSSFYFDRSVSLAGDSWFKVGFFGKILFRREG